jgi:ABC-type transport system involved in cytochrome bd biosynthesis fused ATPase/permease subunit
VNCNKIYVLYVTNCSNIRYKLATERGADQIMVLHQGEIVERGNHEELMKRRGRYYKMYQLQKGELDTFDKLPLNK